MKNGNNRNQVFGIEAPTFTTDEQLLKISRKTTVWWENPKIVPFLYIALAATDAANLFSCFDNCLTQSVAVLWIIVLSVSVFLILLPSMSAVLARNFFANHKKISGVISIIASAAFLVLFGVISNLRYRNRDMLATGGANDLITSIGSASSTQTVSAGQNSIDIAAVAVFCTIMLCAGAAAWILTWAITNPVERRREKLVKIRLALTERLDEMKAAQAGCDFLEKSEFDRLKSDDAKYAEALSIAKDRKEYLRAYMRMRLSEGLNSPQATSELSLPHHQQEKGMRPIAEIRAEA